MTLSMAVIPAQALSELQSGIDQVRANAFARASALQSHFVPAEPTQDDLVQLARYAQAVLGGGLPPLFVQALRRSYEGIFVAYTTIDQGLQALEAELPYGRHAARAA